MQAAAVVGSGLPFAHPPSKTPSLSLLLGCCFLSCQFAYPWFWTARVQILFAALGGGKGKFMVMVAKPRLFPTRRLNAQSQVSGGDKAAAGEECQFARLRAATD